MPAYGTRAETSGRTRGRAGLYHLKIASKMLLTLSHPVAQAIVQKIERKLILSHETAWPVRYLHLMIKHDSIARTLVFPGSQI
jgi:hypothetical protein